MAIKFIQNVLIFQYLFSAWRKFRLLPVQVKCEKLLAILSIKILMRSVFEEMWCVRSVAACFYRAKYQEGNAMLFCTITCISIALFDQSTSRRLIRIKCIMMIGALYFSETCVRIYQVVRRHHLCTVVLKVSRVYFLKQSFLPHNFQ